MPKDPQQKVTTASRLVLGTTPREQPSKNVIQIFPLDDDEKTSGSYNKSLANEKVIYTTQHNIDHIQQTHGLCREVLFDDCLPCCDKEGNQQKDGADIVMWMSWSIIRSEVFLYSLHLTSIILGTLKEETNLRKEHPEMALITTCVETSATLLLVLVRMGNGYAGYRAARSTVRHDADFDPDKDVHIQQLRRWLILFEMAGSVLFAFPLVFLLICHYHLNTGWTILSNNFSMFTILAVSALFTARVLSAVNLIREDQYKVVIYEAAIFIEEADKIIKRKTSVADDNYQTSTDDVNSRGKLFVEAVRSTKLFEKPSYIKVADQHSEENV